MQLSDGTPTTTLADDDLIPAVTVPGVAGGNAVITPGDLAADLAARTAFTSRFAPLPLGGVFTTGGFFASPSVGSTTGIPVINIVYLNPISIADSLTLIRIGIEITTGVATSTPRLGIFTRSGIMFTPILDAGTVVGSTTGAKEIVISKALTPGIYWLAFCNQVAAAGVRCATGYFGLPASNTDASQSTGVGALYLPTAQPGAFVAANMGNTVTVLRPQVFVR